MSAAPNRPESRKILLIIPYRARDLEGAALLSYHLEKTYGHEVIPSNGYGIEEKILKYGPDAVIFDHLVWDFKVRQARLAKSLGMKILMVPTEGFHQDLEEPTQRAGKLSGICHELDCHFVWGDYVRRGILDLQMAPEDRVHTVGSPRFDFYSEPYLGLMEPRTSFLRRLGIKNPAAPTILWATSSAYASMDVEKVLRRHVGRGNLPEREVRAMLEDCLVRLREHSAAFLELARRHPDWNFVVKVHPAEWIKPYVELVRRLPNLHLAFDAPIREFLYNTDVLLQRGCTTATEAWMLGKPVLELEIGEQQIVVRPEITAGNDVVRSIDEADAALVAYVGGRAVPAEQERARQAVLTDNYFRIDGRSSERCARRINAVVTSPSYTNEDQKRTREAVRTAYEAWGRAENRRLSNRFKDLLGIRRETSLRFWKRLKRDRDNLGLFVPEIDITREMLEALYPGFDRVHAAGTSTRARDGMPAPVLEGVS
jgi:surface carbohydrate biosynthesis protein